MICKLALGDVAVHPLADHMLVECMTIGNRIGYIRATRLSRHLLLKNLRLQSPFTLCGKKLLSDTGRGVQSSFYLFKRLSASVSPCFAERNLGGIDGMFLGLQELNLNIANRNRISSE